MKKAMLTLLMILGFISLGIRVIPELGFLLPVILFGIGFTLMLSVGLAWSKFICSVALKVKEEEKNRKKDA